ncbi:HAMP domain-containing histidine kinase [Rhodopseudomonas sp. P2A-2r]|uniref:sensor histidine kinase n=1 Tax=Rhodopseudomonas sp. P2A-2r TaxID=2991972 RepID=UPI002233F354|nr:HAMP domain-containing sensor histidine kinase [Rhodopseudomonas sp. P2A-2r]UZE48975.1 HAMP domain-containing histidine kinase [Rhodopseudomonas sp. P2A-2r]
MLGDASLSRRLLIAAGFFIAVAMVIATVLIGFVLHRFVQGQIDQRLDTQIVFLSSMLRADGNGRISLVGNADGPPFERPHRGWYWQVTGPANTLRSASLEGDDIARVAPAEPAPPSRPREDREPRDKRPRPADGPGPGDEPLHFRIKQVAVSGAPLTIVASAPRAAVWGPLREAMTTLGFSLAVLGLALVTAMMFQIRLGLRPLERLRRAVADVRRGAIERVPARQPQEIQPLVVELNGLLDENAANLERARRHVANLAHGLKTPLATLAIAVSGARDPATLQPLIGLMERRIRHHLGRARSAALSGPVRTQTLIAPRLADLGAVLGKINAAKPVLFALDVPHDCAVACEQQDFDEMAGNLMENGFKWAHGKVAVHAVREGRMVVLSFEDDGNGLPTAQREQVLRPGERLDESAPGFGFGLSITSELAELYGGDLRLVESPLGGLRAILQLPAA